MICQKCGKNVPDNAGFCPFCGTNLKEVQESMLNQQLVAQPEQLKFKNNGKKYNKTKRDLLIIIAILIVILIIIIILVNFLGNKNFKDNKYGTTSSDEMLSVITDENGIAKFIDGTFTNIKVKSEDDAFKALETLKEKLLFKDVNEEFLIESVETSEDITYYKFQQKYKDIEVYGNNLIISVDKNGNVLSMSGYYIPDIDVDLTKSKKQEEIEEIVKQDLGGNNVEIVNSKKYIYADDEYKDLVYIIDAYSDEAILEYIIDANTGKIINNLELAEYAAYEFSGKGVKGQENVTIEEFYDIGTLKTRYRLVDPIRNIEIVDGSDLGTDLSGVALSGLFSTWTPMIGDLDGINFKYATGEGKFKDLAENGITTLKTFEEIYDYYYNVLGRKSYDNKGSKIIVNIGMREKNFGKEELQNAAWLGLTNQMYIGYWNGTPFGVSKDVLAHEISHGVISKTANFAHSPKKKDKEKAFETGALDEGIADILGSLIEGENWTINEDIEIFRSLSNPTSYKNPGVKGGQYYYPDGYINENRTLEQFLKENNIESVSSYDDGGKHHNSTVPGHAAYLMYQKGAFSSREQMAKVWYNSLFLMSSYSNFEDCALAVIKTSKNQGLSSDSIRIIEDAFRETNMLEPQTIKINGTVSSGEIKLSDVKIELKSINIPNMNYTFTTKENGNYAAALISAGTYEITFTKDNYEEYKKIITIRGDTTINVELASLKAAKENNKDELKCKSGNCHILTIYFLEDFNNIGLKENYKTYTIDDGTVMGADVLINTVNNLFGGDLFKTDGETFNLSIGELVVDFAWYYRDTDTKFNFNKPITEDVEIEMKLFDGVIDNDFIKDLNNIFNSKKR